MPARSTAEAVKAFIRFFSLRSFFLRNFFFRDIKQLLIFIYFIYILTL